MRTCRTCNELKDLDDFPFQPKHGFRGQSGTYRLDCKVCTAAKAREYRKTYVVGRTLRKDVDKLAYAACSCRVADAKARAVKSKLSFALTTDVMYDLLYTQRGICAISGVKLSFDKGSFNVLSIDKIDPNAGYTLNNVQWVAWAVNRAKGDLPRDVFIEMCRSIVRCNDYPEMEYSQVAGSALPA